MEAGRELDALVAEKVMGLETKRYEQLHGAAIEAHFGESWCRVSAYPEQYAPVPNYSTDIAAAWEVVEKTGLLEAWGLWRHKDPEAGAEWRWLIGYDDYEQGEVIAEGDTAPHAICLAALKAVSSEEVK